MPGSDDMKGRPSPKAVRSVRHRRSRSGRRDWFAGHAAAGQTIKRRHYERAEVVEYWIVDPEIDVIRVYRRDGERFARPMELSREDGDVLTTAVLPGLEIPSARVFGE